MSTTVIVVLSLIFNVILLILMTLLIIKNFELKKRIKQLVSELGSDSLEHYLNEIKNRGFDFSLKPKNQKKVTTKND
jgi:hypothetical protein